jgi:DNA primase
MLERFPAAISFALSAQCAHCIRLGAEDAQPGAEKEQGGKNANNRREPKQVGKALHLESLRNAGGRTLTRDYASKPLKKALMSSPATWEDAKNPGLDLYSAEAGQRLHANSFQLQDFGVASARN